MATLRNSLAALGLFSAALLGASAAANATPVPTGPVSFNDIGIGNFSGYNPLNIIDNSTGSLEVTLSESLSGLVTTNLVIETLNGNQFHVTDHGSVTGSGNAYEAGFTFNLPTTSYIQYVPNAGGQTWAWTKGVPAISGGTVTPGAQIGWTNESYLSALGGVGTIQKYTLLFSGIVDLAPGGSTSFGGTISTVPLPGSLVMFGSALIGLTAFGARRRSGLSA